MLLLEHGARPDFEDRPGQTPLSRAVRAGNAAIVELLNLYSIVYGIPQSPNRSLISLPEIEGIDITLS
jgi:ankyrin repeat protein